MEQLENKINAAYDKLGIIDTKTSEENIEYKLEGYKKEIEKPQIKNSDFLQNFCSEYHKFACERAPICKKNNINTYSISTCDSRGNTENLDGLYKLIVNKINSLKTEVDSENNENIRFW